MGILTNRFSDTSGSTDVYIGIYTHRPRFLCRLTALIILLLPFKRLNGNSKIINAVKRQRNLGLIYT